MAIPRPVATTRLDDRDLLLQPCKMLVLSFKAHLIAFLTAMNNERYLKAGSLVLLIALCIARPLSAADPQEQTWFTAENPTVDRPVDLPKNVQASLMKDTVVLNLLGSQNKPAGEFPAEWFTASEIHLRHPDHVDLVVMGTGLLMGANINPFWVFRHTSSGFRLVLKGGAHDLEVRKARSNGYRNIRLYAMTAKDVFTLDYRFDGHRYRIYRKNSKPIA